PAPVLTRLPSPPSVPAHIVLAPLAPVVNTLPPSATMPLPDSDPMVKSAPRTDTASPFTMTSEAAPGVPKIGWLAGCRVQFDRPFTKTSFQPGLTAPFQWNVPVDGWRCSSSALSEAWSENVCP